jgi:Uma2 family endonuclease
VAFASSGHAFRHRQIGNLREFPSAQRVLNEAGMRWHTGVMSFGIPVTPPDELEYPSSDGQPMAETELHAEAMVAAYATLKAHFVDRSDVAHGIDMLQYYEKGNPAARFAPDVWVAIGAPKRVRRVYKYWEEPAPPTFVLEVSSRGTWVEDHGNKKAICARLGVLEYFLFDPEAEYLNPVLQGFRLVAGQYERIEPNADGNLESHALGLELRSEGERIRFLDSNGLPLAHYDELADQLNEAEVRRKEAEARRKEAEARRKEAEAGRSEVASELEAARAEIERLKRELARTNE